ncbi:MAG TPA: site-2 protease family protein, partial [Candidatus Binatus sp.]|nr:site-2 protease family protein [Candidatus Binatus sp.]
MSFRLARIYGIPIRIHYTLWIVFFLIAWFLATSYMPTNYPGLSTQAYWIIGLASAALLFLSVLVHELSHSIIAKRNGLPISRITLFFFGGVSEIGKESRDPWLEVRMAAAGPLTSFLLAIVLGGGWFLSKSLSAPTILVATFGYSASLNAILGGFNLIPAFPLDGGRVLRGGLWGWTRNLLRATSLASRISRIISIFMVAVGFLMIVFSDFINGLWIFFLGWVIRSGAENSLQQTILNEALAGITVRDIMTN